MSRCSQPGQLLPGGGSYVLEHLRGQPRGPAIAGLPAFWFLNAAAGYIHRHAIVDTKSPMTRPAREVGEQQSLADRLFLNLEGDAGTAINRTVYRTIPHRAYPTVPC